MKNETMIKIYRIVFVFLLILFLLTSALGFSKDLMFKISLLIATFMILTFILLLFEIQEDYFNKVLIRITELYEYKQNVKEQGVEKNGNQENIIK